MKKIALLIAFVPLFVFSQKLYYKKGVKSVKQVNRMYSSSYANGKKLVKYYEDYNNPIYMETFDRKGNKLKKIEFDAQLFIKEEEISIYKRNKEVQQINHFPKDSLYIIENISYDKKKRQKIYAPDIQKIANWDKRKDYLLKKYDYYLTKKVFTYQKNKENYTIEQYNYKNELVKIDSVKYDPKKREVLDLGYTPDRKNIDKKHHFYNKKGKTIKSLWYNEDLKTYSQITYTYNKYNVLQETKDIDLEMNRVVFRKFNDKGDEIEYVNKTIQGDGEIKKMYEYLYDAHGNWIQRKQLNQKNEIEIVSEREILYY